MRTSGIIVKNPGSKHFTKELAPGTTSDRLILPESDGCRVKVTLFQPKAEFQASGIQNKTDETILVLSGTATITAGGEVHNLYAGVVCHIPAGTAYDVTIRERSVMMCVFSQAGYGPLPDNK